MSQMLAPVTPEMLALAQRSADQNPHRGDEPYRRALIGMYSRLAASLHALTGTEALRHAVAPQAASSGQAVSRVSKIGKWINLGCWTARKCWARCVRGRPSWDFPRLVWPMWT